MITRMSFGLRAALVAAAGLGWWTAASAQMTPSGISINNRASVNYSVGGLPQAVIESSPTGNTTPGSGAGVDTAFLVDNMINLTVDEISSNATVVTPGQANAVLAFTVANTGNSPQGYQLTLTEEVGTALFLGNDNANFGLGNLAVRVDDGNGIYDGTEAATAIDTLNPSQSITVFVLANPTVPLTLINGSFANVRLTARAAVAGTNGGTLEVASLGANTDSVETLFADVNGRDGMESDVDQFAVVSAGLTITKVQTVLDDPFASASPRAIPGANVEYAITIENTSTTTPADGVSLSDPVPANTGLRLGRYAGQDVGITGGLVPSCTADAADADSDGCGLVAGTLSVDSSVLGNVAASAAVTVRFQVTIN
jgi:uncharacterized repeat protein (TIGR01451 family)